MFFKKSEMWIYIELFIFFFILPLPFKNVLIIQGLLLIITVGNIIYISLKTNLCLSINLNVLLPMMAWILWLIIVFFLYFKGFARVVQSVAMVSVLMTSEWSIWDKHMFKYIGGLCSGMTLGWCVHFLFYCIRAKTIWGYACIYEMKNCFGTLAMIVALFYIYKAMVDEKNSIIDYLFFYISIFFVIVSQCRSAMLFLVLLLILWTIFNNTTERYYKILGKLIIYGSCVFVLAFSYIYPSLFGTPVGSYLNDISRKLFHKNFFSGRHILWKNLITIIEYKKIFGHGLDKIPNDFFVTSFSSHNIYIQTALQCGWIGVMILLVVFIGLGNVYLTSINKISKMSMCVLVCNMFHETLEINLTQNNWNLGIFMWILLGIGLNQIRNERISD